MKSSSARKSLLVLAVIVLVLTGTRNLWAHDGEYDSRHHYYRDNYGYWDDHDHYRHYILYHNHHGYWDDRGPFRVFINVD
jgi:hypothetical protein